MKLNNKTKQAIKTGDIENVKNTLMFFYSINDIALLLAKYLIKEKDKPITKTTPKITISKEQLNKLFKVKE